MIKISKLVFLILVSIFLFASCEKSQIEAEVMEESFYRANSMKFHFLNSANKDLLNLKEAPILPVAFTSNSFSVPSPPLEADSLKYNYKGGSIAFDTYTGLYSWQTYVYGLNSKNDYTFYVSVTRGDVDTINVHYRFIIGSPSFEGPGISSYAVIEKMYYNNVLVMEEDWDEENGLSVEGGRAYVIKDNEKTIVTLER